MRKTYEDIANRWSRCEAILKKAERLRGKVLHPSVNELRYAGRRVVDALVILSKPSVSEEDEGTAAAMLNEAFLFCMRAEHDCVDAIVLYLDVLIKDYDERYDRLLLRSLFPTLIRYKKEKRDIDALITASREDRENRDDAYQRIISEWADDLIALASDLESSEELLDEERRQREEQERNARNREAMATRMGWAGLAVGVIGLGIGIASLF